jgi:hypothetical protein
MQLYIAFYLKGDDADKKNRQTQKSAERLLKKPKRQDGAKVWRIDVKMKHRFILLDGGDIDKNTEARNWRGDVLPDPAMVTTVKPQGIEHEEGLCEALRAFSDHARDHPAELHEVVLIGHGENFCLSGLSGARLAKVLEARGLKPKNCLINIVSCKAAAGIRPVSIQDIAKAEHVSWAKDFHRYFLMKRQRCVVKARCATVVVQKDGRKHTKFTETDGSKQVAALPKQEKSVVYFVGDSDPIPALADEVPNELVQLVAFKPVGDPQLKTQAVWLSSVDGKAMPQALQFIPCDLPGDVRIRKK